MAFIETISLKKPLNIPGYFLPIVLLALGCALRVYYGVAGPVLEHGNWSDMRIYLKISHAIENGSWEDSHFFQSIGYPLIITFIKKLSSDFGRFLTYLQVAASVASLGFFYLMINQSLGRKIALISLTVGSVHLPWILFSNFALPESIFICLLSICGYTSQKIIEARKNAFLFCGLWGGAFILAFWLKGIHALWGPLFLLGLFFLKKKQAIMPIMIISSVVATGLAAHALLTYSKVGKIQLGPSTSGLNFVEGKCPSKINIDSAGYQWQSPLYYQLGINTQKTWTKAFTNSGYFFKEGLRCIKDRPWVLIQSLESIPFLFYGNSLWPFNRMSIANVARLYEVILSFFMITGLTVFCVRFRTFGKREHFVMWVIPVIAIFLCVFIFKSEMRYRIPFDLWLIPMAVKGWLELAAIRKVPSPV